jgi:serine/threonine protein kinase
MSAVQVLGGRYELGDAVGHGASTETFRARDTVLDRVVAVRLPRDRADSGADGLTGLATGVKTRFLTELKLAPLLDHPAIAAVYDGGEAGLGEATLPFEVVEYVDGETVREVLGRDAPSLTAPAAQITDGVLRALEHSHGHGIVHRRVSPGNVMLSRDGQVKLINFGLAAARPAVTTGATTEISLEMAAYLAPELIRGDAADPRSDLYSAGCLLYALLTGAPPYTGETVPSILYRIITAVPPLAPSQVAGDSAAWADAVVSRALAADPDERYQSAAEMREAIDQARAGRPDPPAASQSSPPLPVFSPTVTHTSPPPGQSSVSQPPPPSPATAHPPAAVTPVRPQPGPGVGARLAGYRLEEQIGQGGMSSVFLAIDERLGRQAAVKILAPVLATDESFRQRFARESRAAAAVDHPNILPVYEAGEADGVLYIAMRYVSGGDVLTRVRQSGALPPDRAVDIVTAVASALDVAHAHGLVHRDVKPANILLDPGGQPGQPDHVYLTDFGLTTRSDAISGLTAPGTFLGTMNYVAPEQIEGLVADSRTDQYSLACSAFEMLTGSPPFEREESFAILWAHVNQDPPAPTSRRPGLPDGMDAVFARAMAKNPADRFRTCGQFAAALQKALEPGPAGQRRAGPRPVTLTIPLMPAFRYVHEPTRAGQDPLPSLGNEALMAELQSRILHSRGGTFLVTGFRGVGKSTLVLRTLDEIRASSPPGDLILPVQLSVARSTTTERLMFAIVRRVFETLSDSGALEQLPPATRHALLVAYMRTSLAFKETQADARERSAGLEMGLGPGKAVQALADFAAPKISMSAKRSHSLATEAAFLAYSETDAEYDLMRIVSLVSEAAELPPEHRPWYSRWRPGPPAPPRLHLVIVIDEVDKLTADAEGLATVEELLGGIKNVLTMPGVHFLLVAGPDLHDRAIRDAARGNGVYESVFGWRLYVPCTWDAPDRLVANIISKQAQVDAETQELLVRYLRFKARGVPRRLLQELNSFVSWDSGQPHLHISPDDLERVKFYARIEGVLLAYFEGSRRRRLFPVPIDEDRWRLGGYYVADWVLQSGGDPFTAADLLRDGEDAEFDPLLRISRRSTDRLLDHLAANGILEVVREVDATSTVFADVAESSAKTFRLADEIRELLYGFVARNESERGALDVDVSLIGGPFTPVPSPVPGAGPAAGHTRRAPTQEADAVPAPGPYGQPAPRPYGEPVPGPYDQPSTPAWADGTYLSDRYGATAESQVPAAPGVPRPWTADASPAAPADPAGAAGPAGAASPADAAGAVAPPPPVPPAGIPTATAAGTAAAQPAGFSSLDDSVISPPAGIVRPAARVLANRYELGELVSQGGMSSVYKGTDRITGQLVAVKLLRSDLADDPIAMARFVREADIARQLKHPQIAMTHALLQRPGESPALITEWLAGPTLSARIAKEGPMPAPEVAATGRILAEALSYIASQQVVRLDLKPSSIIMAARGPVIADLGIALRSGVERDMVTQTGFFVGTPAYMPRELINSLKPDQRADIYALGLVMYFCLAGRNPWEDLGDQLAILAAIVQREIDVSRLPVSGAFRAVLAKALAGERDDRYDDAAALKDALSGTPEWHEVTSGPAPRPAEAG